MTITESAQESPSTEALKGVLQVHGAPEGHWVGDGFPVRTMCHYEDPTISPFLLLDHAGPHEFAPSDKRRGVGEHPHRGTYIADACIADLHPRKGPCTL